MKKLKSILLVLLIIPCCFLFTACTNDKTTIVKVEKVNSEELGTIYKLFNSDGSTSYFVDSSVESSTDLSEITLEDIYNSLVDNGYTGTYFDFIKEYLTVESSASTTQLAVAKAINSTVDIYTSAGNAGAGVIYEMGDDYSYIVTNFHVVYNESKSQPESTVYALLYNGDLTGSSSSSGYTFDGDALVCTYVGGSDTYDLAVLRVPTADILERNSSACGVTVAENYYLAETAIAIGNPNASGMSVTEGIVSKLSVTLEMTTPAGRSGSYRVMQIDASINPGNSGGGLFNGDGELIGIVNARRTANSDYSNAENIAYALPIDDVSAVVETLISNYESGDENTSAKLTSVSLGIRYYLDNREIVLTNGEISESSDLIVYSVNDGSIADEMGIRSGDIINGLMINDEIYYLTNAYDIKTLLFKVKAGDEISLLVEVDENSNFGISYTVSASDIYTVE